LQQNEKRTQEKAKELENRQAKSVKQEKDWKKKKKWYLCILR
jgi:hypothetical protein